ncbi:MAG: MotA/TolQ/ExbB proton channel family protein [Gammaproteobacteria bacterium]
MKRICLYMLLSLLSFSAPAKHLDLDQLLQEVKKSQGIEGKINRDREARFLSEKNRQQQLLQEARSELAAQENLSRQLKSQLDANEKELAGLETELKDKSGVLGELFGVARQAAGDLRADFDSSLTSAQFPNRSEQLTAVADNKALPTIDQLETLWFLLQQEMTESGNVVRYKTEILSAAGEPHEAEVIRIGSFNALADGKYLRFLPETGKLAELARQPSGRYLDLAEEFSSAGKGYADAAVDPTRGVILGMLIQTPDTWERIQQGGAIGYLILFLGLAGLAVVAERLITLTRTAGRMNSQLDDLENTSDDNPLGRVISVAENASAQDTETLELLLDEAITREAPKLERGLSMIKLLAAVAPLLGLLGTVTGMISTFQSISLFGTGDPKLMAGGISEALVTTMLGLMVAIPLLFLHSLVAARSKALLQILDEQSAGLIARRYEKKHAGQ